VHQHGACITDNNNQDMGRSRGGLTSKIHAVVNTNGLPVYLAPDLLQPVSVSCAQLGRARLRRYLAALGQ